MDQQAAVITFTGVTYVGTPTPGTFNIQIESFGENTLVQRPLMANIFSAADEMITAQVPPPPGAQPFPMQVQISVTTSGGPPMTGNITQSLTAQPGPGPQNFQINVPVASGIGPSGTLQMKFQIIYRITPYCWTYLDCPCYRHYYLPIYYNWLCAGRDYPNFLTMAPVANIDTLITTKAPVLTAITTELGLTNASVSDFFPRLGVALDVITAATDKQTQLTLRRQFQVSDIYDAYEGYMADYVALVALNMAIVPYNSPICQRWRELLDCYCRICANWAILPMQVQSDFNTQVVPAIAGLYQEVINFCPVELLPYCYYDPSLADQCARLRNVMSFFNYWCRRCYYETTVSLPTFQTHFEVLQPALISLQAQLDAAHITICNPPLKDFCPRWRALLDCLKKLCANKAYLSSTILNDIVATFNTVLRDVYAHAFGQTPLYASDINGLCSVITELSTYYERYICFSNAVPGGILRRQYFEDKLVSLEGMLSGFKTRNTDLCAASTPLTNCTDWLEVIDCLSRLCSHKEEFTTSLGTDFMSAFSGKIDNLYWAIRGENPGTSSSSVATLCSRIAEVSAFFHAHCPGSVDPILLIRLNAMLTPLRSTWSAFTSGHANICSTSVTIPTGYCDDWYAVLNCLQRICTSRGELHANVLDAFLDQFGSLISYLYWIVLRPTDTYGGPGSYTASSICAKLATIIAYFDSICPGGSIDPVRKLRLDAELALWQAAYNALLETYPDICVPSTQRFCDDWVDMLDCLVRLCDHRTELAQSSHTQVVVNTILPEFVSPAITTYNAVFGSSLPGTYNSDLDKMCAALHALLDWFVEHCACGATIDAGLHTTLTTQLASFVELYAPLRPCPCITAALCPGQHDNCRTETLTLDTGMAPWMVTVSQNGGTLPRSANNVTGPSPYTGTSWISGISTYANATTGWTRFKRCFCLDRDSRVRIDLTFKADDRAEVYLDGELLGQCALPGSGLIGTDRYLASGLHCVEIRVENNPAGNMGLDATGALTDPLGALLLDECCDDPNNPPVTFEAPDENALDAAGIVAVNAICCGADTECERMRLLPIYAQLLCCRAQGPTTDLDAWLVQAQALLPQVMFDLGLDPNTMLPVTNDRCGRLRLVFKVWLVAFAQPWRLHAILRYKLGCLYDSLQVVVAAYAIAVAEQPYPCDLYAAPCGRWIEMLACLCKLCEQGQVQEGSAMATQIYLLADYIVTLPDDGLPFEIEGEVENLCETVWWMLRYFALRCIECDPITAAYPTLGAKYDAFHAAFTALQATLGAGNTTCGDATCTNWLPMLECLAKLAIRKNDLPAPVRDQMDSSFVSLIDTLYTSVLAAGDLVYNVPSANPASATLDALSWKIIQMARAFYWFCSPYYRWNPAFRASLQAQLTAFRNAYNSLIALANKKGVHFCDDTDDACGIQSEITSLYNRLCVTAPDINAAPIAAINNLLTGFLGELTLIKTQLQITVATPAPVSSFCARLAFTLQVIAEAYSRVDELTAWHRLALRMFMNVLRYQAWKYWPPVAPEITDSTPAGEFRARWMELLDCLCRICRAGTTLPQAAQAAYTTLTGQTGVGVIHSLYTDVVTYAGQLSMPVAADPCSANAVCAELRTITTFFATFCFGCTATPDQAHTTVMGQLDAAHLAAVRALLVTLRSILEVNHVALCTEEPGRNIAVQSTHLYLQAAGSDSTDGSAAGVHLRWDLLNALQTHIPKGNLAAPGSTYYAPYGANKANDFVKIYRTPYDQAKLYKLVLNLENTPPTSVNKSRREWHYDNIVADASFPDAKSTVVVRFEAAAYDARCNNCNPLVSYHSIIVGYTGLLEVRVMEKTMFAMEITSAGTTPTVQVEARSSITANDVVEPIISFRKSFTGVGPHMVMSEGMKVIRFRCLSGSPKVISIQTYEDFHRATQKRYAWTKLGDFSLSTDQTEVFRRLEDSANFVIDNAWPHFLDGNAGVAGKVKAANYRDRWNPGSDPSCTHVPDTFVPGLGDTLESLSGAVTKYLSLAKDAAGWEANVLLYSREYHASVNPDKTAINLSLLKMLKLVARDYHVARMLGFGYIDWQVGAAGQNTGQKYVYVAEYSTMGAGATPDGTPIPNLIHRYLSLPTAPVDWRLPVTPAISDIQYGLPLVEGQTKATTDSQGYATFGDVRFVRLNKHNAAFDQLTTWTDSSGVEAGFFADTSQYSRGDNTMPIAFGVRHKMRVGVGSYNGWEVPEISNDAGEYETPGYEPYRDAGNQPETLAIPDKDNPILVHRITPRPDAQPFGIRYGIYGINWFSRVSTPNTFNDEVYTQFPKRNTLLAPSRLTALFVQPETPRLFNSDYEQNHTALHNRSRLTFNWNHVHNAAYQPETAGAAIKLEFFFRSAMPAGVRGDVLSVTESGDQAAVKATSYPDYTSNPAVTIVPHIAAADAAKFIGGMLVTDKHSFQILSIDTTDPDSPVFTVKKAVERDEEGGPPTLVAPEVKAAFLVMENLADTANWQTIPGAVMPVAQFSAIPHTETEVQPDGTSITRTIGGIYDSATIKEEWLRQGPGPNYGDPIPGTPSGVYKIMFATQVLPAYTTLTTVGSIGSAVERVEWYGGVVRVIEDAHPDRVKVLDVVRIETDSDPLSISSPTTVYVYDPEFSDTAHLIMPRGVGESRTVNVNFHPGYRVYLNLPAAGIALTSIMPQGSEVSRETFMTVRAYDTSTPSASTPGRNQSSLTPPAVHMARQIIAPQVPEDPDGPEFATRPDVYGKSTYTFDLDIKVASHALRVPKVPPYAMMFYRADDTAVLQALYTDATIAQILDDMPPRDTDTAFEARWKGLVNGDVGNDGHFKLYSTAYQFPDPDRATFSYLELDTNGDPQPIHPFPWSGTVDTDKRRSDVRRALSVAFLPLTEQPVMFAFVADDTNEADLTKRMQTSPRRPSVRDRQGQLLMPNDPLFDPFPMIKRIAVGGDWRIRFTDYTLDGASKNFFFYYATEFSNTLENGPGSTVVGPIRLVNAMPPTAPTVLRVNARVAAPALNVGPSVQFTVASYAQAEGITKLRLYRTTDATSSGSVRTMTALTPDFDVPEDGVIADMFAGTDPTFGVPIYYRVVALRSIVNEAGAQEYVPSMPSKTLMATLIDVANPAAPVLTATLANNGTATELPDITLHWSKTLENGTYYLYMMTKTGTWKLIQTLARTNAATMTYPESGDFNAQPETHALPRENSAGATIYYRFKVVAENVSGLLSLEEKVLTVSE